MKKAQSKLFLVSLIIISIIIVLIFISYFSKGKQEISCDIRGNFNCKEVKVFTQAQPTSQNYVLLEATDVKDLRVIPESVSISNCTNAYINQSLFVDSGNKDVKIILECVEGAKEEKIGGSLEIFYTTLYGDIKKEKLIFSVKRVETFKQIIDSSKEEIKDSVKKDEILPPSPVRDSNTDGYRRSERDAVSGGGGGTGGGGGVGGGGGGGGNGGGGGQKQIDTATPTIIINSPTDGQIITNALITVSGTASDDVFISNVKIRLNNGAWQTATDTTSWSIPLTLNLGGNLIEAQVFDTSNKASNITNVSIRLDLEGAVDTISPKISVTHSLSNPTDTQQVTLNAIASDVNTGNSGISQIQIYGDKNILVKTCTFASVCILVSCTCDTTPTTYSIGTHTYYATATDNAPISNIGTDPLSGTKSFAVSTTPPPTTSGLWVSAYLASWKLHMGSGTNGNYGNLPYQTIDWSAFTHIIMFALKANSDGSITYNNLVSSRRKPFNDITHANGKPILISVGGAGNTEFKTAISSSTSRTNLVNNLLNILDTEQYDGIDIDLEPISSGDVTNYQNFINELYNGLQIRHAWYNQSKKPLLTAAMIPSWQGQMFVELEPKFDQINIMTYDMGGTWFGKTWHNNGIYSRTNGVVNEADKDIYGAEMTTIEKRWEQQMGYRGSSGQEPNKLKYGIGIDFYGYVWSGGSGTTTGGVTAPRQTWTTAPSVTGNVEYASLRANYLDSNTPLLDLTSKVPYVSIDMVSNSDDRFVSFTDELSIGEMVQFARDRGAGGTILWELGGGYLPSTYSNRDRLLQAVKQEVFGTGGCTNECSPSGVRQCSGNGYQTCGNYDADSCLEWGTVTACSSEETCSAGMCISKTSYTLSVTKSEIGSGTVTSSPVGINCGADCSEAYSSGTLVTLTATASSGSTFTSWTGCDSVSGTTCTITINNLRSVNANFDLSAVTKLFIYQESLNSPWLDASYTSTRDFANTEQVYAGTKAIKIIHGAWGTLAFRNPTTIAANAYNGVKFAVHGGSAGLILDVRLRNDAGGSFPRIRTQNIPANTWVLIEIPMTQLNPNNLGINTLSIEERSGVEKTFYVDEVRFFL